MWGLLGPVGVGLGACGGAGWCPYGDEILGADRGKEKGVSKFDTSFPQVIPEAK